MRFPCSAFLIFFITTAPSFAEEGSGPHRTINVFHHGAKCNGVHDDTNAFRAAINADSSGGVVSDPTGRCVLTDPLIIDSENQVSIVGAARGSQVFQRENNTLLQLKGVQAVMIKDIYLGSA